MPPESLPPPSTAPAARATPSFAASVQAQLSRIYGIDGDLRIDDFVRPIEGAGREALLVREEEGELELAVELPACALHPAARASLDEVCQVVEGVSHFVYLVERVRRELPTTQLELELQAEVDKFVVLVLDGAFWSRRRSPTLLQRRMEAMRQRLYERVTFAHPAGTEEGDRYRLANDLAARFVRKLAAGFIRPGRFDELRAALRRFYRAGQTEKIALSRAA